MSSGLLMTDSGFLIKFEVIELDFSGVAGIGQGFADEVFRVFPGRVESVKVIAKNTNEAVQTMIEHVRNEEKTEDV